MLLEAQRGLAAAALATCLTLGPVAVPTLALADAPTAEAQATLRRGFAAAQEGLLTKADSLLSESLAEWQRTRQPPDEVAALYKSRGMIRQQQGRLAEARDDFTTSIARVLEPAAKPDPAEVQRTYQLRARVNERLRNYREEELDLSAAIARLDDLDAIEATNPFLFSQRAVARMRLDDYAGAADDSLVAEEQFGTIGDKIRRTLAAADSALALYGAGDEDGGVGKMRYTFKNKGMPASNNPDDIALLQELSRKDAELHLAYAGHLFAQGGGAAGAQSAREQWESGCIRVEAYVQDGAARLRDERELRAREEAQADAGMRDGLGRAPVLKAESVRGSASNTDLNAILNGLDPQSPYVTQRPGQSYFWYKLGGETAVERRDAGNALAQIDESLSCAKFRDPAWVRANRPEWPEALTRKVEAYAAAVPQAPIVMPKRGGPSPS